MNARQILTGAVVVLAVTGAGRGDFVLSGTQHLDVTAAHSIGVLYDSSTADVLAGGYITSAYVNDGAHLRVQRPSGSAIGAAWVYDAGLITLSSGEVSALQGYDTSTLEITGGSILNLYAYDTTAVGLSGGSLSNLYAYATSSVLLTGGSISSLRGNDTRTVDPNNPDGDYDTSALFVSAGTVGTLHVGTSNVKISGGTVSLLNAIGYAAYNRVYFGTVNFRGYDFRATGGLTLDGQRVVGTGVLTGRWFDGTPWATTITHAGATIMVISDPPISGDTDLDWDVDFADYGTLEGSYGMTTVATWAQGDFDGDRDVDFADYQALEANFGTGIPDPAALSLLALGGLALIRRRRG